MFFINMNNDTQLIDEKLTFLDNGWCILYNSKYCSKKIFNLIVEILSKNTIPDNWIRVKSSRNSIVWKFLVDNNWFIFKEYLSRSVFEGIKAFLRGTRAERAWRNSKLLIRKEIPTPTLILLGKRISRFLNYQNFLITEFIPNAVGINTLLRTFLNIPWNKENILFKRFLIQRLGTFVGRLHAQGIMHGDLRLDNILLVYENEYEIKFYLIDNEKTKYFLKGIPNRLRLKNLVQLNMIILPLITITDRMRFFKSYLNENPSLKPFAKIFVRKVILSTRKRLQKRNSSSQSFYKNSG